MKLEGRKGGRRQGGREGLKSTVQVKQTAWERGWTEAGREGAIKIYSTHK